MDPARYLEPESHVLKRKNGEPGSDNGRAVKWPVSGGAAVGISSIGGAATRHEQVLGTTEAGKIAARRARTKWI